MTGGEGGESGMALIIVASDVVGHGTRGACMCVCVWVASQVMVCWGYEVQPWPGIVWRKGCIERMEGQARKALMRGELANFASKRIASSVCRVSKDAFQAWASHAAAGTAQRYYIDGCPGWTLEIAHDS